LRCAVHDFEDELTNGHSVFEFNIERSNIPDFELEWTARIALVILLVAETGVNGRCRYVNADAQPSETALALDASCQPGALGQLEFLDGPAQEETVRTENMAG